ncbi:hypothetical protein BGZ46_001173 [Entomortierella lignicola]|nr:hypothetical protein BGZ46_001173 [Entomortierella lignicola]
MNEHYSEQQRSAKPIPIAIPPPKHPQRHQPVKIHTLNSSSFSSFHLSKSPSSMSFLNSPPPMTPPMAPKSPFHNNVGRTGRSRSSSRSGGVVFTTRPRADSEAARTAMEAMIQARLDQITKRLERFNSQSHELHAKTQQLDKVFHEKSKRLYMVEDHLLRLQGKPGLSESNPVIGRRPRRLTNDLDELSMGVKTLRRKFQIAGSTVATVGWRKQLKDVRDQWQPIDSEIVDIENLNQNRTHLMASPIKNDGQISSKPIFINPNSSTSSLDSIYHLANSALDSSEDAEHRSLGLRSPPITPKGTSLLSKGLEERHFLKSRPLSIIPDLEEPQSYLASSPGDDGVHETTSTPLVATGTFVKGLSSSFEQQQQQRRQNLVHSIAGEPRSLADFTPPSPSSPISAAAAAEVTTSTKWYKDAAATESDEPKTKKYETVQAQVHLKEDRATQASTLSTKSNDQQEALRDKEEDKSSSGGWIQALWRLLIRAEYVLLGTAVLGAMMPDNFIALIAGFLSAIMYGILIIHHRLTAPPGKEAPHPPTNEQLEVTRKKLLSEARNSNFGATTGRGLERSIASLTNRRGTTLQEIDVQPK